MAKQRLDLLAVAQGLAPSREKAKAYIMEGQVLVDGERVDKPGQLVLESSVLTLKEQSRYVSRGGLKLEKAVLKYQLAFDQQICMDLGASTGGFTDCMLQHGAQKVYAVDVGYGQLAWTLRNDPRVVVLERTNARYLNRNLVPDPIDFFSVDVSFISLQKVLPPALSLLQEGGRAVALVKPQFEAGREFVGKKGVVRDPAVHQTVLEQIYDFCLENKTAVLDLDYSPIKGPQGNIEYLIYLQKDASLPSVERTLAQQVVAFSHQQL